MSSAALFGGQTGAFTLQTAQAIQAAIRAAGFLFTGNIYYCWPANGNDNGPGTSPSTAFATLGAAYTACASGNNDVVVLIGNGQSTGTARISSTFTWAKNATHLLGVCAPSAVSQRSRIAPPTAAATTAFANFFIVSGSGCMFQNISWFHGFTTGVAAEICMTITGSRNAFINCDFEGMGDSTGATDAGSRSILISGGGQENVFSHCNVGLDTVTRTNANSSVEFQNGSTRNTFENCTFPFYSSDGLQYAALANAASSVDRWNLFRGCLFIGDTGSGGTAIAQLFHMVASAGGIFIMDLTGGWYGVTALGDTTTKAQVWTSGVTATNVGGKGIVAT